MPLKVEAAQIVYAPMFSNPSQSPTSSVAGRRTTLHTQSSESHVGPHTLAEEDADAETDKGTWKDPLCASTYGCGAWWSKRMQLNAPYTPSLM